MDEITKQSDECIVDRITKIFHDEWIAIWFKFITNCSRVHWYRLSSNSNVTMEMIENNPELQWDWRGVSNNLNITMEYALKYHNLHPKKWSWHLAVCKPNITMDDVFSISHLLHGWDWDYIGWNVTLTLDIILQHPNKMWYWTLVSSNYNIPITDALNNSNLPWDWSEISKRPNITINIVTQHPNIKWDWYEISQHKNVYENDIITNPNLPWNWHGVSKNPNITMDTVLLFPDKRWCWSSLSKHPKITMEIILTHPDKPWNFRYVSGNPNITLDFVLNNPDRKWNRHEISKNKSITMNDIERHPEIRLGRQSKSPWSWKCVTRNPNITIDFIIKNMDKPLNWRLISSKQFLQDKNNFIMVKWKWLNVATLFEYYNNFDFYDENNPYSLVEMIFMDSYLVKHIVKY